MTKLLSAYRSDPSLKNALALRAYNAKHPMAACVLSLEDAALLAKAIFTCNRADRRPS